MDMAVGTEVSGDQVTECAQQDSNLQPTDYESAALTVELWAHSVT